ncbi:MAG: hypothetical protein FWB72_02660 [Firmicutes bacterium]|nr:hypothetical protein [Bacillota bacterium]
MDIYVENWLMQILIWVLRVVDAVFAFFRLAAGVDYIEGQSLVSRFLGASQVMQVFWGILVLSILITAIAMGASIIKNMINLSGGERKPIQRIIGQGASTVFITLFMMGIVFGGITVGNAVLRDIDRMMTGGHSRMSNIIFELAVEQTHTYEILPSRDAYGEIIWLRNEDGEYVRDEDGNRVFYHYERRREAIVDGWRGNYSAADIDVENQSVRAILGSYNRGRVNPIPTGRNANGMIQPGGFNFLVGYLGTIFILIALLSSTLALTKRLFDMLLLFLTLPLIVATIPYDDGVKFKAWRETFVSKFILAYGAVFAINVFIIAVPIIQGLPLGAAFPGAPFVATVARLFLLIGAGLAINGGQLLFARLFGTSAEESREMSQAARTMAAGGMAAFGGAKLAVGAATGGVGAVGMSAAKFGVGGAMGVTGTKGGFGMSSGVAGKAGNVVGKAFRGGGAGVSRAGSATMDALRGPNNKQAQNYMKASTSGSKSYTSDAVKNASNNSAMKNRIDKFKK